MSRFYAAIQGNRGEATRMGTPNSGIAGHIRGWDVGVRVNGDTEGDSDVFQVFATGGSNGKTPTRLLGEVRLVAGCPTFVPAVQSV